MSTQPKNSEDLFPDENPYAWSPTSSTSIEEFLSKVPRILREQVVVQHSPRFSTNLPWSKMTGQNLYDSQSPTTTVNWALPREVDMGTREE